jgi:limonene-1,2-epoxide hydrolase
VVFTQRLDVFEVGGEAIKLPVTGIFEVEGGKIAAWREYFDFAALASQSGVDVSAATE